MDWWALERKRLKCGKFLFSIPNPFSDICYTYDGLVSTVLPSGRIARTVFYWVIDANIDHEK